MLTTACTERESRLRLRGIGSGECSAKRVDLLQSAKPSTVKKLLLSAPDGSIIACGLVVTCRSCLLEMVPQAIMGYMQAFFFFFNEEYGLRMKASPVPTSCARQGARCGWRRRPHAWRDTSVECAGGAGSGCHGNKSGTYKVVGQLHGSKHSAATTLTATESTLGGSCAVIPGY